MDGPRFRTGWTIPEMSPLTGLQSPTTARVLLRVLSWWHVSHPARCSQRASTSAPNRCNPLVNAATPPSPIGHRLLPVRPSPSTISATTQPCALGDRDIRHNAIAQPKKRPPPAEREKAGLLQPRTSDGLPQRTRCSTVAQREFSCLTVSWLLQACRVLLPVFLCRSSGPRG